MDETMTQRNSKPLYASGHSILRCNRNMLLLSTSSPISPAHWKAYLPILNSIWALEQVQAQTHSPSISVQARQHLVYVVSLRLLRILAISIDHRLNDNSSSISWTVSSSSTWYGSSSSYHSTLSGHVDSSPLSRSSPRSSNDSSIHPDSPIYHIHDMMNSSRS